MGCVEFLIERVYVCLQSDPPRLEQRALQLIVCVRPLVGVGLCHDRRGWVENSLDTHVTKIVFFLISRTLNNAPYRKSSSSHV